MWRRALLAAAAVSYLICVLIMSGLQKEDLDVSMLGKLQRYNVNFDDINNEQIRQQCALRKNGFVKDDQKEIKEVDISTTEYMPIISTNDPLPSNNYNNMFMNLSKTQEDYIRNMNEATTVKTTSLLQEMDTLYGNVPTNTMDLLRRFIQLETLNKSIYKMHESSETAKRGTAINLKSNQTNSNTADEVTIIDKLIKGYLLKKQKITTTTEQTTSKLNIDIRDIYKKIDEIFANDSNIDNIKGKLLPKYPDQGGGNNVKYKVISSGPVTSLSQKTSYPTGKQLFDSFYNFLNEMNQFSHNSSRLFPTYIDNINSKDKTQAEKIFGQFNQKDQEMNKENTTYKSKSEKEKEPDPKALTPSLVKEIADTVKNVIIKELRNELAGIYLKTTQMSTQITSTTIRTTTDTLPTTTLKSKMKEKDLAIMDKFMDLYEQIKSLKQSTYLLRASNESTHFVNKLKKPPYSPKNSAMIMPAVNVLQIQEPKVIVPSVYNYQPKPLIKYNSYHPKKENRVPITIQTNSVEIQPLAVPLSKPESMIRQNIIVHTRNNYQHRDKNNFKYYNSRTRYTDSDVSENNKNRTHNYNFLKQYDGYNSARYPHCSQMPKQRDDVIRFRVTDNGNSRLNTDYYEKINFGNNYNGVNEKRDVFGNRKYPRFHERLERIDPESDRVPVVSDVDTYDKNDQNSDLPSRHQLSLVDMKKGTSYDDTHFKNFLKTQQKVTDMLERILATRPKTNTPRSVEAV